MLRYMIGLTFIVCFWKCKKYMMFVLSLKKLFTCNGLFKKVYETQGCLIIGGNMRRWCCAYCYRLLCEKDVFVFSLRKKRMRLRSRVLAIDGLLIICRKNCGGDVAPMCIGCLRRTMEHVVCRVVLGDKLSQPVRCRSERLLLEAII